MQHFISLANFSADELWGFLHKAKELKDELTTTGKNRPILQAENRLRAQKGILALLLAN